MRQSKIASAALCMGVLIAAGCSSGGPSKADLTSAIDNYYAANPQCIFSSPVQLPAKVDNSDQQQMTEYSALAQAGLVTKQEPAAKQPEKPARRRPRRGRHVEAQKPAAPETTTFALADTGRFSWTEDPTQPGFGNFCYGHRHVSSIDSSAASKKNGTTTAVASYHYSYLGVPDWAKSSEVQAAFPEAKSVLSGPQTDKANFIKDPTGWKMQPPTGGNGQAPASGGENQPANPGSSGQSSNQGGGGGSGY